MSPESRPGCLCGHSYETHFAYARLDGMRPGWCYGCECYPPEKCHEYRPRTQAIPRYMGPDPRYSFREVAR